ncbi:MAG TPA: DNA alkylation response protein [Thermoprotei archaeon]|nr:DNA alkylation response protein [Thermoprotei archaeon]
MKGSPYRAYSMIYGKNVYELDLGLRDALKRYMGGEPDFHGFGRYVSSDLLEVIDYVDKYGSPHPIYWDLNGERIDDIWISPSLRRELEKIIAFYGVNRPPIHDGDWLTHMTYLYMMGDAGVECIVTVTMQTAYAIYKYGDSEMRHIASHMFGDGIPVYYGATWFSEVNAGSDLGGIETLAKLENGVWRLYGIKYFTSNIGFADYALVVARVEGGRSGVKGLSLFLMPTRDRDGRPNYRLIRLKDKLGTINVPTGEIELDGSMATPIGDLEKGYYYALENLMISRLANTFGSVGLSRRAIMEVLLYASNREAFGRRLVDHLLYRGDLLILDAVSMADLILAIEAVKRWEMVQEEKPPYSEVYAYARVYNHMAKAVTAKHSIYVTGEAMELMGGRGFLKDFMIERLHREALVTSIWEGTTNIHSLDFLEALIVKNGFKKILEDLNGIEDILDRNIYNGVRDVVARVERFIGEADTSRAEDAVIKSKSILFDLARLISLAGLYRLGDINSRYLDLALIYYNYMFRGVYPDIDNTKKFIESISYNINI